LKSPQIFESVNLGMFSESPHEMSCLFPMNYVGPQTLYIK